MNPSPPRPSADPNSVIAAGHPETAAAGRIMLQRGGNAVDAAVAAAFVSFIAEIGLVHWGGSGLAIVHEPRTQTSMVYDFLSTMPGLAGLPAPEARDFAEVEVDFGSTSQQFRLGRAAVAVPGAVFGLCRMARDCGRLPLPQLLAPAIRLAREGVALDRFQAETCRLLEPLYTHTEGMREIFSPEGALLAEGDALRIPGLAETLEALADSGADELVTGRLAQAIVSDQAEAGGLLSAEDLSAYRVERRAPIRLRYRGLDLLLPPPPSSGGLLTAFTVVLMSLAPSTKPGSTRDLRRLYEAMSITSEARTRIESMLEVLDGRDVAERVLTRDFVRPYAELLRARLRAPEAKGPASPRAEGLLGNTTHISVLDSDGMAVSLTTTAGESAGYVVPGTGFIPNNMLGEADVNPHGWHAWPPGVRIPSMMTPMLALENGHVRLVTGSGGSERIRSAILQVLTSFLDHEISLVEAVERPRVHLERGVLQCEAGFDPAAIDGLEALGYPVNRWSQRSIYFGGAHSVGRMAGGRVEAAGDSRRAGVTSTS